MSAQPLDAVTWARRAISLIDLTDLADVTDAERTGTLCERAARHGTAAVCVWPDHVATAVSSLSGTPVRVATVVNFPTGDERAYAVGVIAEHVRARGADEVDLVLPYRALSRDDVGRVAEMLDTVRRATVGGVLKVILETGELADPALISCAADLAIDHGADFIKTSTGKTPVSATPEAVAVMLDRILASGRAVGIKPSGGIATLDHAVGFLRQADAAIGQDQVTAARFRFGASGLLDALLTVLGDDAAGAAPSAY